MGQGGSIQGLGTSLTPAGPTPPLDSPAEESEEEESEEEEEEEEVVAAPEEVQAGQEEDFGVEYLLRGDEERGGQGADPAGPPSTLGPKKEITDIAATAESLQPKGYTLATTQVYLPYSASRAIPPCPFWSM